MEIDDPSGGYSNTGGALVIISLNTLLLHQSASRRRSQSQKSTVPVPSFVDEEDNIFLRVI